MAALLTVTLPRRNGQTYRSKKSRLRYVTVESTGNPEMTGNDLRATATHGPRVIVTMAASEKYLKRTASESTVEAEQIP